ncbi:Trans-4-hydroxy-L-proline dehydratase [subsurface metagenome]
MYRLEISMNERIKKLREQSLRIHPDISTERASLLTDFYQSGEARGVSNPVVRALAFRYIMENKAVLFNEGELIVGERGTAPRATPTYPEITMHSLKDLEILDSREKTSYYVDEETRELYEKKIIPYWKGRSIRERIFKGVSQEWKDAFEAGVFTAKRKPPPLEVVFYC